MKTIKCSTLISEPIRASVGECGAEIFSTEDREQRTAVSPTSISHLRSPIQIAKAIYDRKHAKMRLAKSFEEEVSEYRRTGIVRSTSKCFILAREVFLPRLGPAWFCACGVGDLQDMVAGMPYPLGYVAFPRRDQQEMRVYRTERFLHLIRNLSTINYQPITIN